jgi:hypothetical protein
MKFVTNRIFLPTTKKVETKTAAADGITKTASTKEANIANLGEFAHGKGKGGKKEKDDTKEEVVEACDAEASAKVAPKTAEVKAEEKVETYDAGKKEGAEFTNDAKKEPEDAKKPEKESGKAATTTTKTPEGTFPSSGQPQWEGKAENNNKPEMPTDKNTQASASDLLKTIVASLAGPFQITANLKPELKKKTKEYWRALYGDAYAEAMVCDK